MRHNFIYTFLFIAFAVFLQSCGCGFTFLYNWRPKPWNYRSNDSYTGLDTLIDTKGFYITENINNINIPYSIMFYNNGLCLATSVRFSGLTIQDFDIFYSNEDSRKQMNFFFSDPSWGTYEVLNDTVNAYVIESLIGCDGTRKNVIQMSYIITKDKKLKQFFRTQIFGGESNFDNLDTKFYSVASKRDSMECSYLDKGWFRNSGSFK